MTDQIRLRTLVDQKIERAIAAGQDCPFPPSYAADLFHARKYAAQLTDNAAPAQRRVDLAQVA